MSMAMFQEWYFYVILAQMLISLPAPWNTWDRLLGNANSDATHRAAMPFHPRMSSHRRCPISAEIDLYDVYGYPIVSMLVVSLPTKLFHKYKVNVDKS